MKFKELEKKGEVELQTILSQSRDKVRDLRFKTASKQLKNVREIRQVRATIARTLMLLKRTMKQTKTEK